MAARFGGTWEAKSQPETVSYNLPAHATEEVCDYWRKSRSQEIDPRFIARIPGGRVFGSGAVLSPDGGSVARDVSVDFGKGPEDHWLLSYPRIRTPVALPGVAAVAATALGNGYAHWLLEELPRLLALKGMDFDYLIAHETSLFAREARPFLQISAKTVSPQRLGHLSADELIIPSLAAPPGYPTPELVRELNRFADEVVPEKRRGLPAKIYVSRQKAKRRLIANEAQLRASLEERGFVTVHLEELTWTEQISLFRNAREVVGAHGAGLANLVFCQTGTRVCELLNRVWMNGCYWRLSSVAGLEYQPVVSSSSEVLQERLDENGAEIRANLEEIKTWMQGC